MTTKYTNINHRFEVANIEFLGQMVRGLSATLGTVQPVVLGAKPLLDLSRGAFQARGTNATVKR